MKAGLAGVALAAVMVCAIGNQAKASYTSVYFQAIDAIQKGADTSEFFNGYHGSLDGYNIDIYGSLYFSSSVSDPFANYLTGQVQFLVYNNANPPVSLAYGMYEPTSLSFLFEPNSKTYTIKAGLAGYLGNFKLSQSFNAVLGYSLPGLRGTYKEYYQGNGGDDLNIALENPTGVVSLSIAQRPDPNDDLQIGFDVPNPIVPLPVSIPASAPLFGAALLALSAIGYLSRRSATHGCTAPTNGAVTGFP